MLDIVSTPLVWCALFGIVLLYLFWCMIFGKARELEHEMTASFVRTGVDVIYVFLPFFIYGVASLLKGSILNFLMSPELPMASMLIFGMVFFSSARAASKNPRSVTRLLVQLLISIFIFSGLSCYVFWLSFSSDISPWFSVLNCFITCASVVIAYVFLGSANYMHERQQKQ